MQTRRSWDRLLEALGSGRRYILPDLPGLGESLDVAPDWTTAVEATLAVMPERAHLTGYSLGGRLALAVAAAAPHRLLSLATIGAHAGLEAAERPSRLQADRELAGRVERDGMEWFASYWASLPLFAGLEALGRERTQELAAMRLSLDARGVADSLRGMGAGTMEPLWDRLAALTAPALFVAGEHDTRYVAWAERLAAATPGGRAAVVPGAGHPAHLERPGQVATLLEAHWAQAR